MSEYLNFVDEMTQIDAGDFVLGSICISGR